MSRNLFRDFLCFLDWACVRVLLPKIFFHLMLQRSAISSFLLFVPFRLFIFFSLVFLSLLFLSVPPLTFCFLHIPLALCFISGMSIM